MRDEFENYMNEIQLSEPIKVKIREICSLFSSLYPNRAIEDIFVSQQQRAGAGVPDTLALFSEGLLFEALRFPNEDIYQITHYEGELLFLEIRLRNYNFLDDAAPNSSMAITFSLIGKVGTDSSRETVYKALGSNCDHLRRICEKHLLHQGRPELDILREIKASTDCLRDHGPDGNT